MSFVNRYLNTSVLLLVLCSNYICKECMFQELFLIHTNGVKIGLRYKPNAIDTITSTESNAV